MEDLKVSDEIKLPCINCVCMAVCRNKPILNMFHECQLITQFWSDYIDASSNIKIAVDIISMCIIMNETLKRCFVPYFRGGGHDDKVIDGHRIQLMDIEYKEHHKTRCERLKRTYRIFRQSFKVDMLDMPTIKPHLLPIVKDIVESIEG